MFLNDLNIDELLNALESVSDGSVLITDISIISNSDSFLVRYRIENSASLYEAAVMFVDNQDLKNNYVIIRVIKLI